MPPLRTFARYSLLFFYRMLDNYKRKLASLASRLTTRKPESREEAQGLLSSQSLDSLEIFADGDNDRFNIVYWVKRPLPPAYGTAAYISVGFLFIWHCHASALEW